MPKKSNTTLFQAGAAPWILAGAIFILLPILAYVSFVNINRQKTYFTRMLMEKGGAIIRSIEAGSRASQMGWHWSDPQLGRLLLETGDQPDIAYLLVVDVNGLILSHSSPAYIFGLYGNGVNLEEIAQSKDLKSRVAQTPDGKKVFEVYRRFLPSLTPPDGYQPPLPRAPRPKTMAPATLMMPRVIFVGLDMGAMEAARKSETQHTIVMGVILLLIGLGGMTLLFSFQDRRSAKIALSREKAFSSHLVRNVPTGLVATDENGEVKFFNHIAGKILDADPAHLIGRDVKDALPKKLRDLSAAMGTATTSLEQEMNCRVKKTDIPLQVNISMIRDENGTCLGHIFLLKDLTQIKRLRNEIEASRRLASVGRLAAGVAHEIRNPLSSIKGFATYFMERYGNVRENAHISSIMINEIDRVNRVVGQLLEFAKPMSVSKTPVNIKNLLENSLKMIAGQAREKNIKITVDFSAKNPKIQADGDRMAQVFLNIFLNALESMETENQEMETGKPETGKPETGEKSTAQNCGVLNVRLSDDHEQDGVVIDISDTGAGIFQGDMDTLFDPYFTTKASGSGLGLAMAHTIINAHGGEIKATNRKPRGACFTLFLKRRP